MTAKVLYVFFFIQIFSFDRCFSQDSEVKVTRPICSEYRRFKPPRCDDYVYELDLMGCPTSCGNPCSNYTCSPGEACVAEELTCINPPCGKRPRCVCIRKCVNGYETDSGGCKTCRCREPCQGVICPVGQYCSVEKEQSVCIFPKCLNGTVPQLDSDSKHIINCIVPRD